MSTERKIRRRGKTRTEIETESGALGIKNMSKLLSKEITLNVFFINIALLSYTRDFY